MTFYLKDGSRVNEFGNLRDCLEKLLRETLGADVVNCFNMCIAEYEEKARLEHMAAEDHEMVADGYHSMCNNALENFEAIIDLLKAQRINKAKLLTAAQAGYNDIYKNM